MATDSILAEVRRIAQSRLKRLDGIVAAAGDEADRRRVERMRGYQELLVQSRTENLETLANIERLLVSIREEHDKVKLLR